MQQIIPPMTLVRKIMSDQKKNEEIPYRLTTHCMRLERPEGVLLYHTLTGELLLLSREEAVAMTALPSPVPPALEVLVPKWFLRPVEADDMALADQMREIMGRFAREKKTALTEYTIFTTMDCNARCFYCYEAGWKRSSMSEQTAKDTAEYIAAHCGGKPIHLSWFGGEPLVNVRAIDVITDSLRRQGVSFYSIMTSNGYLFDEALVKRAKDDWNLKRVQITLDGTEEVYNQRKAYVNPKGSPYRRVLQNIGLLLEEGIRVKIRLNMDNDNERDLYALVDELAERFAGKSDFGIYCRVLSENKGMQPSSYPEEERLSYAEKFRSLQAYVEKKGVVARAPLSRGIAINACIADSGSSATVTPEGLLGWCEACKDGDTWGSIYSDETDKDVLRQWRERKPPDEACKTCSVYPQCARLKKCPSWLEHCSPIERSLWEDRLRRAVLTAYKDWKTAGQNSPAARI